MIDRCWPLAVCVACYFAVWYAGTADLSAVRRAWRQWGSRPTFENCLE